MTAQQTRNQRRPRHPINQRGRTTGFTLVELLVVVSIIALLISVLIPGLARARKQSKRLVCLSQQRQIATAMHNYAGDYDGQLPIAQYLDAANNAWVAWDTVTPNTDQVKAEPGLIWRYGGSLQVQQCPSYRGPSMTTGDPFTGYNYNTTYLGRGQHEGPHAGLTESPARLNTLRRPAESAMIGDGGWRSGANKFMRAPMDTGVSEGTVHAGGQAFRHEGATNVAYSDTHASTVRTPHRKPGARYYNAILLGFPKNGFLAEDDRPYKIR